MRTDRDPNTLTCLRRWLRQRRADETVEQKARRLEVRERLWYAVAIWSVVGLLIIYWCLLAYVLKRWWLE